MANNNVVPYTIFLEDSNTSEGHIVIAVNRTTGEKLTERFSSDKQVGFDLAKFPTEVVEGDIIEVKMLSKYVAFTTHTVSKTGASSGGVTLTWTSAASPSNLVAVSL